MLDAARPLRISPFFAPAVTHPSAQHLAEAEVSWKCVQATASTRADRASHVCSTVAHSTWLHRSEPERAAARAATSERNCSTARLYAAAWSVHMSTSRTCSSAPHEQAVETAEDFGCSVVFQSA